MVLWAFFFFGAALLSAANNNKQEARRPFSFSLMKGLLCFVALVLGLARALIVPAPAVQSRPRSPSLYYHMAPPNQPSPEPGPPKRETSPLSVPTVGLGNQQVRASHLLGRSRALLNPSYLTAFLSFRSVRRHFAVAKGPDFVVR